MWRDFVWGTVFLALTVGAHAAPTLPVVRIDSGEIAGEAAGNIVVFRGIPYAAPPVGALRWRAPRPAPKWAGIREADKFGPACPQGRIEGVTDITRYGGAPEPTSEDCLTLNVWTPAHARHAAVIVWIHGGSGRIGSGSLPYYDGAAFAEDGVVLVTINYRLGNLGAFAYPGLRAEAKNDSGVGNYALLDQIAALQWVKRNIAAFGGDARNVTIAGESSGGISVLTLTTSPAAEGLFAKAVVESAGGWYPPPMGAKDAEKRGTAIASAAGAPPNATLAQLRAIPAWKFADVPGASIAEPDDRLVPESPTTAIAAGRQAHVPLLIGVNDGEDSLLDTPGAMKKALAAAKPGQLAKVEKLYGPGTTPEMALRHELTDGLAAAPARWIARRWSRQAPAYLYRFEHVDEWRLPKRTRAAHGAEVFYVFKTLDQKLDDPPSPKPADWKLADEVHARWVAFAKAGSPNERGLVAWPAYSAESDPWLVFGQKETRMEHHLLKRQLDWYEDQITPLIWLFRIQAWWHRYF